MFSSAMGASSRFVGLGNLFNSSAFLFLLPSRYSSWYAYAFPASSHNTTSIARFRKDEVRTHPTACKAYCITCHTAPTPIPFYLKDISDDVIRKMESDDVIEPHHGPVTWLSNPVLVPKADGSMRDLRNLNKAQQDTHVPIPRVDDIIPIFTGKSVFSYNMWLEYVTILYENGR